MAGGKQTPRQAMIGMMYLVLLAMLAMNASKDLLNAFIFLEDGIDVTTKNFNNTNQTIYDKISTSAASGADVAVKANKNALLIAKSANELFTEIEKYKKDIIDIGGGLDEETGVPIGKDNQDVGAEYLIVKGHGEILKQKIGALKEQLIKLIDSRDTGVINGVKELLDTPEHVDYEGVVSPWENGISEYLPLAAVTANLTNVQSYIRNAEAQVLKYIHEEININALKVNKIFATTIAQSGYVLEGDEYSANIFLAASDTTQSPIVTVGDYDTAHYRATGEIKFIGETQDLPVSGGIGNYKLQVDKTGNHSWGGVMKIPHPNPKMKGKFLTYPFVNNYTVAAPSAVISSDQLNIMYIGLNNEISVSAPGMKSDDLIVTASNACRVSSKGNGKYTFVPSKGGRINITVSSKINGENKVISTQTWKSKRLPKPDINVPGLKYGKMTKNALKTILKEVGVKPQYGPSFPISTKPKIVKANIEFNKSGNINEETMLLSGKAENKVLNQVNSLRRGNVVTVYIKAKGADGISHNISKVITIR